MKIPLFNGVDMCRVSHDAVISTTSQRFGLMFASALVFRAIGHSNLLYNRCWRGHDCLNIHLFCTWNEIGYISRAHTAWPKNSSTEPMNSRPPCNVYLVKKISVVCRTWRCSNNVDGRFSNSFGTRTPKITFHIPRNSYVRKCKKVHIHI